MERLLISLATRNRPQLLLDTIKKSMACWEHPETRMILQCDTDDFATLGLLTDTQLDPRITVNIQKREDSVAQKWNRGLSEPADLYLIAGDDESIVTPGFDVKLLEAAKIFPDGIGMVYGHMANASFASIMACTKKWCDLLGYILPEHFPYWFSDHWIDDIGRITQRIAFADVRGDQSKIGTTMEMREPAWWATWFDSCYMLRRAEANKIIDALDEPEWRKTILRSHHPHWEYKSKWINDNVRQNARSMELTMSAGAQNERYVRIKQAAINRMPEILNGLPPEEARKYYAMLVPQNVIQAIPQAYQKAS